MKRFAKKMQTRLGDRWFADQEMEWKFNDKTDTHLTTGELGEPLIGLRWRLFMQPLGRKCCEISSHCRLNVLTMAVAGAHVEMLGRGVWPGQSCGAKAGTVADCIGNIGYITWLNHLVKTTGSNNWIAMEINISLRK
jgi:hypothetical protein